MYEILFFIKLLYIFLFVSALTVVDGGPVYAERRDGLRLHCVLARCSVSVSTSVLIPAIHLPTLLRQVLENIRRQSCEGLALPFLANWLLGHTRLSSCSSSSNTNHQAIFPTLSDAS